SVLDPLVTPRSAADPCIGLMVFATPRLEFRIAIYDIQYAIIRNFGGKRPQMSNISRWAEYNKWS
ncbi:hypothetical protein, partial [Halorubrum sp. FL23]|uniref:hypothetical protein n=1 Tax=Halorubrum sp. FL23 TaxID=3458704 RepID=UPI004034328D